VTMAPATVTNRRRELAYRVGGGFEVTLYWNAHDDSTGIELRHLASGTTMDFAVPGEEALDAFYHPLAHVTYSIAP
jgi:hypothetical protein